MSLGRRTVHAAADPLMLLLAFAGAVSWAVLHEVTEGVAIVAIVVINLVVRVLQEHRADAAVRSLRSFAAPSARVRRDGIATTVPASELVRDDLVELGAGERVPADACIVDATALTTDESLLTGESIPIEKHDGDTVLAGSLIVGGHGTAIVTSTGAHTELGKISGLLLPSPPAPLEYELRNVSLRVTILASVVGALLTAVAFTRLNDEFTSTDAVLAGVAMAIAAIPEGLVIAVTMALAMGAQGMAKQGMIVKHLSAIEALGAASILCSDKTGTLTEGQLSVAGTAAVVCDQQFWNAILSCSEPAAVSGDAVDVVLTQAARQHDAEIHGPLLMHQPFNAIARSAATVHMTNDGPLLTVKGAPESVLGRCRIGERTNAVSEAMPALLHQGLRVLAVAQALSDDVDARDLEPLGLILLSDSVRPSARKAVVAAKRAGIAVVMVTGDHADTASAIAADVGLKGNAVSGTELEAQDTAARQTLLRNATVVARVTPSTKVDLVQAHQQAGRIVAMTGDGVNDAPALRSADVGVAVMGSGGTDVAREAADLVVTDGDLGTILTAIAEGRRIYRNIVSVVTYLLSGNLCEIIVVALGLLLFPSLAVPLLPVQILWINLVTDGLPALALGVDRPRGDLLAEPPRSPQQHVLDGRRLREIGLLAITLAIPVLIAAAIAVSLGWSDGAVRAELVTSIVAGRLGIAYVVQSTRWTFSRGWWRGRPLLLAVGGSLFAQFAIVVVPAFRPIFSFDAMPVSGWLLVAAVFVTTVVTADIARVTTKRSSVNPR